MKRQSAIAVIAAYAVLALLVIPVFPHFVSPNELTRWVLAAAIVDHHTIEVSRPASLLGPRFEDLAERDGRLYSNKAPGLALVSLPGYAIARIFTSAIRPTLTAMRIAGATVPVLLLALLFGRLAPDDKRAAEVIWMLLFATPLFAYGLLLFSHALVAAALFGAWAFLFVERRYAFVAGLLLGVAVASEYPAAVAVVVVLITLMATRDWRRLALVIAGGAPIALLLAWYQRVAFGSAFRLSPLYDRLPEYRALGRSGMFGLQLPSPIIAARLLLDPARGLLVFAPVLLLAIPAFARVKSRISTSAFATLIAIPASLFIVYSSYPNWHGGWATGPRYIVACIPFLVFPLLFRERNAIESVLAGWSTAAVFLTSIVFPFPPNAFPLPWGTLALPLLRHGLIAPNLLHLVWRPLALIVPFAIAIAALRGRRLFIAAGVFAAVLTGFAIPSSRLLDVQRAYIADVYFEQHGTLEQSNPPQGLMRRRALEQRLPPDFWPF